MSGEASRRRTRSAGKRALHLVPAVPLAGAVPVPTALAAVSLKPIYRPAAPLVPLQFGTLSTFLQTAERVCREDVIAQGLSENTLAWWLRSLDHFGQFLREARAERAFLSGDLQRQILVIDRWVTSLRQRNLSYVTVRTYWGAMTAILHRLQRIHGMTNPFALLVPPRAGRLHPRVLTRTEAERLLLVVRHYQWESDLLRARNLALIGLMLLAGLRRGEVMRLQFGHVHLDDGSIFISRGKGKYGGKDRTAYMPPQLPPLLREYAALRLSATPRRTHPEFITSARRNSPVTATIIRRVFERVSGLVEFHVSPHMLRHTYATLLRQFGISDRVSMDLMGHESLTMLQRYSHVFQEEYAVEVQKLRLDVDL
jgi:integrase/recombinase XerC